MTGVGSGDSVHEGLPLNEADAALPCMRNGTQERFGGGTRGRFWLRVQVAEVYHVVSASHGVAWMRGEGVGEVNPGECQCDL